MAMAGDGRGLPWNFLRLEIRVSPRKQPWKLPQNSADVRGDCRVAVAMTTDVGKFRGNCRELLWVAMFGTTEFATDRAAARAVDTPVAFTAEVS